MNVYIKAALVVLGGLAAFAVFVAVVGGLLAFAPWLLAVLSVGGLLAGCYIFAVVLVQDRRRA